MIWYRVAENRVKPVRILKTNKTYVFYRCQASGETIQEYISSKKNSWFADKYEAHKHLQAYLTKEVEKAKKALDEAEAKWAKLRSELDYTENEISRNCR